MTTVPLGTILVLDDDDLVRGAVEAALESAGYRVISTGDAMECLRLLEGDGDFGALIADIVMPPDKPHGLAIGSIAALKRPDLKIIYITGNVDKMSGWHVDTNTTPVLQKPVRIGDLLVRLERLLEQRTIG
jgi:two-component system, cell cycle response regulator CpdR